MRVRKADISEVFELSQLWYDGWHDAHANLVPKAFAQLRTHEDFLRRLEAGIANVRVVGQIREPFGFCIVKEDELNQLYVRVDARGTGVAQLLIEDGEEIIARNGHRTAWLACGMGNNRAAKFYEKSGWHLARVFEYAAETTKGIFSFDVWRFEKQVSTGLTAEADIGY